MTPWRIGQTSVDVPGLCLSLAVGTVGGLVAERLHLPLGMLLGSLTAVGIAAISGWKPFGIRVDVPEPLRFFFVPVIGVAIGGAFTPEILSDVPGWAPSLLALLVYLPVALGAGYLIYHRLGGLCPASLPSSGRCRAGWSRRWFWASRPARTRPC